LIGWLVRVSHLYNQVFGWIKIGPKRVWIAEAIDFEGIYLVRLTLKSKTMKQFYATVLALSCLPIAGISQTINSFTPSVGDVAQVSQFSITEAGAGGSGVTWDFSQETFIDTYSITVLPAEEGLGASSFPDATIVFSASFFDFYSYYDFNGGWTEHGTVTEVDGGEVYGTFFSNPFTYFTLPVSPSSTGSDTYEALVSFGFNDATISGNATWSVDGTGTLIMPNATYTDVLRVKVETVESMTFDGIPIDIESTGTIHMWIKAGIPFPLLVADEEVTDFGGEVEIEFNATGMVSYSTGTSSIADRSTQNDFWTAMPNPFQDQLRLTPSKEFQGKADIALLDLNGRLVKAIGSHNLSGTSEILLNLNDVLPGLYLIAIDHAEGRSFQKVVKAAN
jgi:hypothetical protein